MEEYQTLYMFAVCWELEETKRLEVLKETLCSPWRIVGVQCHVQELIVPIVTAPIH